MLVKMAHSYLGEQLYMGRTYDQSMTRKDKMREGYVARTVHIPIELDDTFKMMAIKNHIRFSDMAIIAFKDFFSRQGGQLTRC